MAEREIDFDTFVEAVRSVNLDDEFVHEAAHSSAVSTRSWSRSEESSEE